MNTNMIKCDRASSAHRRPDLSIVVVDFDLSYIVHQPHNACCFAIALIALSDTLSKLQQDVCTIFSRSLDLGTK
jgi:hypothetical protein